MISSVISEKHWRMCEEYIRTAVRNGVNMILTPVFTPELDTYVGGERLTTQLVDITVEADGSYGFGFDKLGRWIDMCLGCGVEYFEIPHFFTQWGATAAPKFVARVGGRTKRIFGWETDSMGPEYGAFLAAFIPALVSYFKEKGVDTEKKENVETDEDFIVKKTDSQETPGNDTSENQTEEVVSQEN